MLREFLSKCGM